MSMRMGTKDDDGGVKVEVAVYEGRTGDTRRILHASSGGRWESGLCV